MDQFKNFPTSNQYEETLSCVSAEMSAPEILSCPSDSPSSEASLSCSSSITASNELQTLLAASALITKLEAICSSGVLPLADEISARELIVTAARAYGFDTKAER
jgi:hypothetical protein